MKIVIAGPIPTRKNSGGVAVFNDNIALTLAHLSPKNKILIATKDVSSVERNNDYPDNVIVVNINNLRKIKKFKPDIIISSLWYSLFFCNNYINKAIKIHILHGFTNYRDYSDWKVPLMHMIDQIIRKKFNYLIANSEFTQYINENIFGIKVDGVFRIGLSQSQIDKLITLRSNNNKNILYIGRLVSAKRVDKIIASVERLKNADYDKLKIVGYGPEKEKLQQLASKNPKIDFLGAVTPQKTLDIYSNARVFVSLNPSEPFGITYEEAIAAGLYVVAPKTGGQVEFLKQFPTRCSLIDITNIDSIKKAINIGLNKKLKCLSKKEIESLNYFNTVKQILRVIQDAS